MVYLSRKPKGIILVMTLMVVSVLLMTSTTYITRAIHEKNMLTHEVNDAISHYNTEAGGNAGLNMLDTLINTNLMNTVNAANPNSVATHANNYASGNDSIDFLMLYTKNGGGTPLLHKVSGNLVYNGTSTSFNNGTYLYTIVISQKGNPSTVNATTWDFPFFYQIQTTGTKNGHAKKFTLNGDFTVRVQKDNFARYALFTNNQTLPDNTNVWFTHNTNFSGPMFSNGRYNFAYNPSGTFNGQVKQSDPLARFYNNGSPVNLNANNNGTVDVPIFNSTFERSAGTLSMPTTSQETSMITEATGGGSFGTNGIYVPATGSSLKGGIYIKGDASITLSVNGSDQQVYTITQGGTTKIITVNHAANQTSVTSNGTTTTYTGEPNGTDKVGHIIYVSGNVTSIGGTVQKDTQVVVASHNDTVIQNHIHYSNYTPAVGTPGTTGYVPPSADGTNNLLGLVSWAGNVRVGASAPNNVDIHATVMAQQGVFSVDNYDTTAVRGTATVLGGVISNYYGGFGTFNSGTGAAVSGYGRNFVYDQRMETGSTPPYFPTMNTFIAFTNDITDKKFWQPGGF